MKTERLLALLYYLLEHGKVSKVKLAEYFEVSTKTIQRDISSLQAIDINIESTLGSQGGYSISDYYHFKNQLGNKEDYQWIVTALQGLNSAITSPLAQTTLTKMKALNTKQNPYLILNFDILKEKEKVVDYYTFLEQAILKKEIISFDYTNSKLENTHKKIEPIGLVYQWYHWYLIGYDCVKKVYRQYKLIRMDNLVIVNGFIHDHPSLDIVQKEYLNQDYRVYYDVLLLCDAKTNISINEYLNSECIEIRENGDYVYSMHLPKDERMWKVAIISFGNKVKVLEPIELKEELIHLCDEFILNNK